MVQAAHFAAGLVACYVTARLWGRSSWMWRSPRAAIVCWQGVGLAFGLCAVGLPLAVGLAPYGTGIGPALLRLAAESGAWLTGSSLGAGRLAAGSGAGLTGSTLGAGRLVAVLGGLAVAALLLGATVSCLLRATRVRRRHRELLSLVARDDPAVPGALVLDHPGAAAYCLPGLRPRVVVSAGTLRLLDAGQLAAVLGHERAHAAERHDLVLLPFTALRRVLGRAAWVRTAADMVALLVEMRADDAAHADQSLAAALRRFASAPSRVSPCGALDAADRQLEARVARLMADDRSLGAAGASALVVTAVLVALPVALFLS